MINIISILCLSLSYLTLNGTTYLALVHFHKLQTLRVLDRNDKIQFIVTSFLLSFTMGGFLAMVLIHNRTLRLTLNERQDEMSARSLHMKVVESPSDHTQIIPSNSGYIPWAMKPYGKISDYDATRHAGSEMDFPPMPKKEAPIFFSPVHTPSMWKHGNTSVTLDDLSDTAIDDGSRWPKKRTVIDKMLRRKL